jgi:hypothetical protein
MKKFDEENLDVLQNIEFAIVVVYRADRSLPRPSHLQASSTLRRAGPRSVDREASRRVGTRHAECVRHNFRHSDP